MDMRGIELTWLGHASVRLRTSDGTVVLIDPWLAGNPACLPSEHEQQRVDSVFITHGHFDHVSSVLDVAHRHRPRIFAIHEIANWLGGKGIENVTGLNMGGTVAAPGVTAATLVPAVHSSGITGDTGIVDGGSPGGWVLELSGGLKVYHAGDTMVFSDMALIGELWAPDIALLPIGGHYTMDPRQAGRAAQLIGAGTVVPIHYGTFPILAGTPDELRAQIGDGAEVVQLDSCVPMT